jgi:hypothetical protein
MHATPTRGVPPGDRETLGARKSLGIIERVEIVIAECELRDTAVDARAAHWVRKSSGRVVAGEDASESSVVHADTVRPLEPKYDPPLEFPHHIHMASFSKQRCDAVS